MSGEPMSGIDLAWLRMERATNPMTIVAVLILEGRVKHVQLRSLLAERLLRFDRFRELPVHDALGTRWARDQHFDLDVHLRVLRLPPRAGQRQLEQAASKLASAQLNPRHPLWQIHLIERYGKGSALIARFHHCYADGIALMRVLLSLADATPVPVAAAASTAQATRGNSHDGLLSLVSPLTNLIGSAMSAVQRAGQGTADLVSASLRTLAHPDQAAALARQGATALREFADIALLPEDPPTPLKGKLGSHKQVAWAQPLSFMEVRAVAHALDCTINDVLLASVAGALGSHLAKRGVSTDGLTIRALVPVNLRPADEQPQLGNQFGLVFANLPIGERNPLARVYAVHQDMQRLKQSSQALVALWLLTAMGLLPGVVEERAIELFTAKGSVVVSNVPGPREPLYLAGARIAQQFFWVPQAGDIGVGISLLTYDGSVHFGLIADRNLISDPSDVARRFVNEFERLLLHTLAGPLGARAS
ncbi:MAG TPA: wax ester/triacylglycerol synthase family O-acyltransferase [Steroidobacteraceae bacterium]|nr:wax ester/triacylglycerol synthase family O-acyltransferase [Steroidobacteraceae bacterium]